MLFFSDFCIFLFWIFLNFAHISIHVFTFVITLWMYCILSCVFVFWRQIMGESLDKPGKMEIEGKNGKTACRGDIAFPGDLPVSFV